ncbi:MAG: DUF6352 family protein [Hyphomicrobiaceae bacterium]
MQVNYWKSAGLHLVEPTADGWLSVTPDLIRAYLTRPEVHPIEDSCANEVALFEALMADPFHAIGDAQLDSIADQDAADNYRLVLGFRDVLANAGTLEGAYLDLIKRRSFSLPPVFLDQLVHIILGNILRDVSDPMRLRAAELFFREQSVNTNDGMIMLADQEIVEMQARAGETSGLGQLLAETGTPQREVTLDVLDDENSEIYWERSDRFDTVIDMRHTRPANNALARVIEAWLRHFRDLDVSVQPARSIKDDHWRWHIGLDRDATAILNGLYQGDDASESAEQQIIALYRMEIRDTARVRPDVAGSPIYLALAMTADHRVRLKPQNLLVNLPLIEVA